MSLYWQLGICISLFLNITISSAEITLSTPDTSDIEYPDDEPPSALEVTLGKTLFYDTRLSLNNSQSCASCHNPTLGFTDGLALGLGTMGTKVGRNTQHLYNLAFSSIFFWDGRAATLEEQALGPIISPGEMNIPLNILLPKLQQVKYYRDQFQAVYGSPKITQDNLAKAIAAFERTIISNNSAFDQYLAGNTHAMEPSAIRGLKLFKNKARCIKCHDGANFTDDSFHNIGIKGDDIGRYEISPDSGMRGAFKTPGLRNALLTAPYMHNGSLGTLEEVVIFYNDKDKRLKNVDKLIKPLNLTDHEIRDLVSFLGALTDPVIITRPVIPKN